MFTRLLVANRGEIAVRIMQTCREMQIETVAVYSDADQGALHVRMADAAYRIGSATARESYLRGDEIIRVAVKCAADAIHPGYGFLAENADFAAAVQAAGLVWVGPPPTVIALLGNKIEAKRMAEEAGVPVVPGYAGADVSVRRLESEAERMGYPVMLKAAAGGGGKGMRVVERASDLRDSLEAAQREAAAAFADDRVFMEKLLVRPRHVEMQILADEAGNVIYLGERDCSLQRRHQKIIEEAPGYDITPALRAAMGAAAVRVAASCSYRNAGTVEFLLDGDSFYFLEVNARLQVEHPVTECTVGLDLVRLQLQIAAGDTLSLVQSEVNIRGHAFEARLYAEDPAIGFLPATGSLSQFAPPEGPGIRNDVGAERGDTISAFYDPLIAKLVVYAETRPLAVARLGDALDRYRCAGVTTNLNFLRWMVREPAFVAGELDIGYIERTWVPAVGTSLPTPVLIVAALVDAAHASRSSDPWRSVGSWRSAGTPRGFQYQYRGKIHTVELLRQDLESWKATLPAEVRDITQVEIECNRVSYRDADSHVSADVTEESTGYSVILRGNVYTLERATRGRERGQGANGRSASANHAAPMPGTIIRLAVSVGEPVTVGEPLVVMEAMKMEHVVEAAVNGTVRRVLVTAGDMVAAGTVLVEIEA